MLFMIFLHFVIFFIYSIFISQQSHYQNNAELSSPLLQKLLYFKRHKSINIDTNSDTNSDTNTKTLVTKYEPDYPRESRIENFPTHASRQEMAKHDRYIIHSILYSEMLTPAYLQQHWSIPIPNSLNSSNPRKGPWKFTQKLCVNITVKNREIPYINALIMSIMGSHESKEENKSLNTDIPFGHRLLSYLKLNLLDAERDRLFDSDDGTADYDDIRVKIFQLPFLEKHSVWKYDHHTFVSVSPRSPKLDKIQDILTSAHICLESKLPWCLMLEEYTIVPRDFLNSLKRFVIAPLESFAASHRVGMETDGEVFKRTKKMSLISLFSAYNSIEGDLMRVHDVEYSSSRYEEDRGKLNSERSALGLDKHSSAYEMHSIPIRDSTDSKTQGQGGFDSAMLFHSSMLKTELIPMLEQLKSAEQARIVGDWWVRGSIDGTNVVDVDSLDLEREFSLYTGIQRLRVEPSLVNRIGFYNQDFGGKPRTVDQGNRIGITNWLTDPRFLFEAGEYSEGREDFCELDNGLWIWDSFHNHDDKSCCTEEFMEKPRCIEEEEYRLDHEA
jgi:hypothetical protein